MDKLKHPGGRPKGSKTDPTKKDLINLRRMLNAIADRVVAGNDTWNDTQNLRTIVPALTPIMTAHVELDTSMPELDLTELFKNASAQAHLPPALGPATQPDATIVTRGLLKPEE